MAEASGTLRYPLVDSIRALAALAILVVHTAVVSEMSHDLWYWPLLAHLDIGVPIFFMLSGCLLYRPMVAARVLGTPSTPLPAYLWRRFVRIAPAYWLALTVLAIVPGLAGVFSSNWWVYYGLLQNYPVYTRGADCIASPLLCGLAPTWTLGIEVAFYVLLPGYALAMRWWCRRLPRANWLVLELAMLGLVSAMSVAFQALASLSGLPLWLMVFSPLGRAWWFGLGMGLAAVSVWLQQRSRLPSAARVVSDYAGVAWMAAILFYAVPALVVINDSPLLAMPLFIGRFEYIAVHLLAGVIGALILLPAVFWDGRAGLPSRLLANPVLTWLGRISYGIFLWHYPIIHGLRAGGVGLWWPGLTFPILLMGTLVLTITCAALSYYLLERPVMRLTYRRPAASGCPG